ncbi:MAG: PD40 domain-containing protein, partial [Calditrichaeota bacterium]|nr:PD40 domain-containing protein [Calditrichota bacterium]
FTLTAIALLLAVNAGHGQYYFGRNKVQYDNFRWHVLQTEHFDIYFYPEMRKIAEIGAAYAEETYRVLEDRFDHNINRRIPLIFYASHAHFQQTNTTPYLVPEGVGGFFEFLKGRVVVPANGSISEFKHVIRHELVHVFTYSKLAAVFKERGRLAPTDLPLWFIEGLAEYWSTGWDSQAEMFIRDGVLNGYIVPLSQMYQIYGSFLMYKEGQAILKYIGETFGEEKILRLIENSWKQERFADVMRLTLGVDTEQFDKQWLYALKKSTYPLLERRDSPEMSSTVVTREGIDTKPVFYRRADGGYVVFVSNRMGYSNIYLQRIDGGREPPKAEVLIKGERTSEFESFHVLQSKIDVTPTGLLALVSRSGASDVLHVFDIEHRSMVKQVRFDSLVSLYSPSWAPDGQRLVVTGLSFGGQSDLYLVDLERETAEQLTNDLFDDRDPAWSPDGSVIAFSSDRPPYGADGCYNLFILDLRTGAVEPATCAPHNDLSPAWSPDGRYLTFTSDRDGAYNIWMVRNTARGPFASLSGSSTESAADTKHYPAATDELDELRQLTFFTTGAFDPDWTDNDQILFSAFENFSFRLRLLDEVVRKFESSNVASADTVPQQSVERLSQEVSGDVFSKAVKYRPKFDLDVAQSAVTQDPIYGTSGGAQLAITDMLGNAQYYFLIYNNARTRDEFLESFNVAVTRLDLTHRTNFAVGLYHFAGRYYSLYDFYFWERRAGGFAAVSYPFSVFNRFEASLNVRYSDKDWYVFNRRRKAVLVSNIVSFVKDNSLWGPTGPVDGERYNLTVGNTLDVQHSHVNFVTLIADYRHYFRISRSVTHALRLMTMMNKGKEATPFFMGGSWDLRGYPLWRIWGTKLALVSNELRFPFIDRFFIKFPIGGLALNAIRGALFVDLGNGWDDHFDELLGSVGFGVRWRIGGVLVLRLDGGRKFSLPEPSRFHHLKDINVDKHWFTQFFFGWDF